MDLSKIVRDVYINIQEKITFMFSNYDYALVK